MPETERILNIHKENAEGLALAAELAVAKLAWSPKERQAWTEFGFYVGQAQGILLLEPLLRRSDCLAFEDALLQAERALFNLPNLQAVAKELILKRLFNYDGDNKKNIK